MFIIKTMVNSANQLVSASHGLLQDSYIYIYIYIYIYMCVYVCERVCIYVCVYIYIYMVIYILYNCIYMYIYESVFLRACNWECTICCTFPIVSCEKNGPIYIG